MGIVQRLMARAYDRTMVAYEKVAGERRRALLARIPEGARVLELGPGTGVNLAHLAAAGRGDIEWRGVEPNPHMRKRLLDKAKQLHGGPTGLGFVELTADGGLAAEQGSVDVVLSTLVLCSVPNPEQTLAEVRRVLAPGGQFLFMEHVGAEPGTGTRRFQAMATPLWRVVADGCCLNRDTEAAIRRCGFGSVEAEAYAMAREGAPFFVRPHVAGYAVK